VSTVEHEHDWGDWTRWIFYGSGLDIREKFCRDDPCTGNDYETRKHQHDYQAGVPDPFAPVGSGLTLKICSACHDVKS
jgi:hypothetical protein